MLILRVNIGYIFIGFIILFIKKSSITTLVSRLLNKILVILFFKKIENCTIRTGSRTIRTRTVQGEFYKYFVICGRIFLFQERG